ncbi:3-hydroxyisobutyrate dehydrogenase [Geodia barretti]|uniref:3-hydroxyisobutyrate dehydrogenase n=1 Tax=Geodia barretti TaxID=519541 RepID=A0AA35TV14_GEOBA|nr:3-hydroxyisobutyrate dehydrogenase [Geodia barretti]
MSRIAFIGAGNMGLPMLRNLIGAGHEVRAYDVSPDALAEAVQAGADEAVSLADAVTAAEIVITMLPEGRHVRAVYLGDGGNDGIIGHAPREALLADCSTIDIATAREVAATASESGYEMIDAPVSGGVTGAAAGTLTFMVGGSAAGYERASQSSPRWGATWPTSADRARAGHQDLQQHDGGDRDHRGVRGLLPWRALGLDSKKLYDVLSTSTGQTWMMDHMHPVPGIVETAPSNRNYAPGFKAALMAKDLGLAQSAAADTGTSTPLGADAAALFRMLCKNGAGELDCSAVYKLLHGDL